MTAKYPFKIGMQEQPIKPGEPWGLPLTEKIMPQYLKEAGYSTHIIGKWHLGEHRKAYLPTNRGFDTFVGAFGGLLDNYDYSVFGKGYALFNGSLPLRGLNGTYFQDLTAEWAEAIIERESQSTKPFFLFVSSSAPRGTASTADHMQSKLEYLVRPDVAAIIDPGRRKYAAMMQAVDETVKRVYESLVRNGVQNCTVLWFLSDNGGPAPIPGTYTPVPPTSNWPLRGVKGTLFEGGVRVPAFVWASDDILRDRRRLSSQLFHISDLLPTFLSIAGNKSVDLEGTDGVTQWNALLNPKLSSPRISLVIDIFNGYRNPYFAAIKGNYKVVAGLFAYGHPVGNGWTRPVGTTDTIPQRHNHLTAVECVQAENVTLPSCAPAKAPCLFDLIADPCELNNLAEAKPEILGNLLKYVRAENVSYVPLIQVVRDPHFDVSLNGGLWGPWLDKTRSSD
ncbi:Arylsulfatase I [Hypsibius exemplaris]|uniref:Arylsulfatase I n=1 Tax=Hypsibius exemplaris TaxID=2072580 RepID=A0A1W0XET4_HYPEX|nr:Arylsulfatase I [Hypsibius exemplaris]